MEYTPYRTSGVYIRVFATRAKICDSSRESSLDTFGFDGMGGGGGLDLHTDCCVRRRFVAEFVFGNCVLVVVCRVNY